MRGGQIMDYWKLGRSMKPHNYVPYVHLQRAGRRLYFYLCLRPSGGATWGLTLWPDPWVGRRTYAKCSSIRGSNASTTTRYFSLSHNFQLTNTKFALCSALHSKFRMADEASASQSIHIPGAENWNYSSYVTDKVTVPVQSDGASVEDPSNAAKQSSNEQLGKAPTFTSRRYLMLMAP